MSLGHDHISLGYWSAGYAIGWGFEGKGPSCWCYFSPDLFRSGSVESGTWKAELQVETQMVTWWIIVSGSDPEISISAVQSLQSRSQRKVITVSGSHPEISIFSAISIIQKPKKGILFCIVWPPVQSQAQLCPYGFRSAVFRRKLQSPQNFERRKHARQDYEAGCPMPWQQCAGTFFPKILPVFGISLGIH